MLIRLSNPDGLAVSVEEVKQHLRIDTDADDEVLERLIRQETKRYEDFSGRYMLPIELEYRTDQWCDPLNIPVYPIRAVLEVAYLDEDNVEQALAAPYWYYIYDEMGTQIWFNDSFPSPVLSERKQAVIVRLGAGYDDPTESGSGDDPALEAEQQDRGVITTMVGWIYDKGEGVPDSMLKTMAGNRRIFR